MAVLSCADTQQNLGVSKCIKIPKLIKGIITTPDDFSIPFTDAVSATAWQTALLAAKSNRIYYWPEAKVIENLNEESIYQETPVGSLFVRDGRYRWRISFEGNLQQHKAMFSHKQFRGRIFLIDIDNKIIGTSEDGIAFRGFSIDLINPEKLAISDGTNATLTPVYLSLTDNLELDENGSQVETGGFLRTLTRLSTVNLTLSNTSSGGFTVTVLNAFDNEPVLGLVLADFTLQDSTGAAVTINAVVDNQDGTYAATTGVLTAGTYSVNLVASSALTVQGFESGAAVTYDVA